jgi:DNA-binding transcriptional LysR family regulator
VLTLHQLQVFVVVADEMSVRRAAERLVVTQPAVSATLSALQRELGVELVTRDGRGIALTAAGRTMYQRARELLGLLDDTINTIRAADGDDDRPMRIAASSSLVTTVIAPILARLRAERPDLAYSLTIGDRNDAWRMLAAREADIALTSRPPSNQGFDTVATMPNPCVVVARPGAVLAGRLGHAAWLVREPGTALRSFADEVIAGLGLDPELIEIGSDDAVVGAVEAGLGVGVLSRGVVDVPIRERRLVVVPTVVTPLERPWHLIVRRGDVDDDRIAGFVDDMVVADPRFARTTRLPTY